MNDRNVQRYQQCHVRLVGLQNVFTGLNGQWDIRLPMFWQNPQKDVIKCFFTHYQLARCISVAITLLYD